MFVHGWFTKRGCEEVIGCLLAVLRPIYIRVRGVQRGAQDHAVLGVSNLQILRGTTRYRGSCTASDRIVVILILAHPGLFEAEPRANETSRCWRPNQGAAGSCHRTSILELLTA